MGYTQMGIPEWGLPGWGNKLGLIGVGPGTGRMDLLLPVFEANTSPQFC
jgi:hypothetical protein